MSYDVTVGQDDFNYTWNLSKFFTVFQAHPYSHFDKRRAGEVAERIDSALEAIALMDMDVLRERYDPANKWGSVPSAIEWLESIRDSCRRQPQELVSAT